MKTKRKAPKAAPLAVPPEWVDGWDKRLLKEQKIRDDTVMTRVRPYLAELRREHPAVNDDDVRTLLFTPEPGVWQLHPWETHRRVVEREPARRDSWAKFQKRNQVINGLQSRVKARAAILGTTSVSRIVAELESCRLLARGAKLRPVSKRTRLWLPEVAARLAEYLGRATHADMYTLSVHRMTARILMLASGDAKITTQLVKGQIQRHT